MRDILVVSLKTRYFLKKKIYLRRPILTDESTRPVGLAQTSVAWPQP